MISLHKNSSVLLANLVNALITDCINKNLFLRNISNCYPLILLFCYVNLGVWIIACLLKGRFYNKVREHRTCHVCNNNLLGDEFHYLFNCTSFNDIRKKYLDSYFFQKS